MFGAKDDIHFQQENCAQFYKSTQLNVMAILAYLMQRPKLAGVHLVIVKAIHSTQSPKEARSQSYQRNLVFKNTKLV